MTLNAAPLEMARTQLDLSVRDLWLLCFGLGGDLTEIELGDSLLGQEQLSVLEYDIVAQALNEVHIDAGGNHPVRYADGS